MERKRHGSLDQNSSCPNCFRIISSNYPSLQFSTGSILVEYGYNQNCNPPLQPASKLTQPFSSRCQCQSPGFCARVLLPPRFANIDIDSSGDLTISELVLAGHLTKSQAEQLFDKCRRKNDAALSDKDRSCSGGSLV